MKGNRKRTKRMSVVASHTMHVFGVIVVLFAMVILNMLASSNCTQLQKTIGEKNRILATLNNDCERESARWDGMKTLDRLEAALRGFGMKMNYPKSVQVIRMDANGVPLVAQNSVNEARRRQGLVATASYKTDLPGAGASSPALQTRAPARVRPTRRVRK